CQPVFTCQLANESVHILRLRPDTTHDKMSRRTIERDAPRAVICIINALVGNGINLRMLRGQLAVKRLDSRVRRNTVNNAVTELSVKCARLSISESAARVPNCHVVAHDV